MKRRRSIGTVILLAVAAGLWAACGEEGAEPTAPEAPYPTTVEVTPAAVELAAVGATVQMTATVLDQNGQPMAGAVVSWASSEPLVATVDSAGLVTAAADGGATITATAGAASGSAEIKVEDRDRATLAAFYEATDGQNWTNNDAWLTNAPLEEWHGVGTDARGRVRSLSLSDNELSGAIPPELGNLSRLVHLQLDLNGLAGPIPTELGDLSRLEHLRLSRNELTDTIPPELGNLSALTYLNLEGNYLSGSIPPELGRLSNLRQLILRQNNLAGPIPAELGDLSRLELLLLSRNKLTGPIPPDLSGLSNLESFEASNNNLSGPILPQLGELSRLRSLNLSYNRFSGPIPAGIGSLDSLRSLSLQYNQLTGPIPASLGELELLSLLNLSRNQLVGRVPEELGNLSRLRSLYLHDNTDLFGPLPRTFLQLDSLQFLTAWDTAVCAPADAAFRAWISGLEATWLGGTCEHTDARIREVLVHIYDDAGGDGWRNNTGWGSDLPVGEWHGVTARGDTVTVLDLSSNDLRGTLSPRLADLEHLTALRLGESPGLGGDLPREIVRLIDLHELHLRRTGSCLPPTFRLGQWLAEVSVVLGDECYDDHGDNAASATPVGLNGSFHGALDFPYDEDYFRFDVVVAGTLRLDFDSNRESPALVLFEGDDFDQPPSFAEFGMSRRMEPGSYYLRVHEAHRFDVDAYRVDATFAPDSPRVPVYLTQAVQSHDAAVPLVAGEDALLRIFVTGPEDSGARMPMVRASFYRNGTAVHTVETPPSEIHVPSRVLESSLEETVSAVIPGSVLAPGLELVVEIDPDGVLDPALGIGGRIPANGRMALDVRKMPAFHLTVVPMIAGGQPDPAWLATVNGLHTEHEVFYETLDWLPVQGFELAVRQPLITSGILWETGTGLSVIESLRVAEGGRGYYMGTWRELSGGMAALGGRASVSGISGRVIAHELGHNFSLRHAPCGGAGGPDPHYPYFGALIGAWGYDFTSGSLVDPEIHTDLMSYCSRNGWISDYHFTRATEHRLEVDAVGPHVAAESPPPERVLLVRGGRADGSLSLKPAFALETRPVLPDAPGPYRLTGLDASGGELFSHRFDMRLVLDGDDVEDPAYFVWAISAPDAWADALDRIVLNGPEGRVEMGRDDTPAEVWVLDAATGRIRAMLDGASPLSAPRALADRFGGSAAGMVILTSRGIPDAAEWP